MSNHLHQILHVSKVLSVSKPTITQAWLYPPNRFLRQSYSSFKKDFLYVRYLEGLSHLILDHCTEDNILKKHYLITSGGKVLE